MVNACYVLFGFSILALVGCKSRKFGEGKKSTSNAQSGASFSTTNTKLRVPFKVIFGETGNIVPANPAPNESQFLFLKDGSKKKFF
jgi:hypothetical protein